MRARSALAVPSSSTPRHVSFIAEVRNFKPGIARTDPWPPGLGRWPLRGFQVPGKPEPLEGGTAVARTDTALMPDISEAESARGYLGSVLRLTVDFLEQRGCKAQVKQKVSAATAALIDKPPFPFAWIAATPMDEMESALSLVAGREACVDLGLTAARKLGGSLIQPVLKMATALFGNTPVAVFQNLERFYAMVLKGMKFDYDAVAPREAVIRVRVEGARVPAALFDVTRGNLAYVFELCGVRGTVDPPEGIRCDDRGGEARYRVRWD
ncbi:MAG: hypothetical protein AUH83_12820 [Deltaproteobacteria bacterium 13_1_40CM_4_68_19]|nr:MAG: hypothetical protein AUH83_12820 [Deltaproteobacteria bacterium 13_1_40CM_4_68_19]